ncbi:MAG: RHS repeat-associated core domain-containing protein [Thermoanaerobaculia bacterium]
MRFVDDGAGGLVPTGGYHGSLVADPSDLSFDFFAKSGRRYHYEATGTPRWILSFVEDPDGNRVDLFYESSQGEPLLVAVRDGAGRTLAFDYEQRTFLLASELELWTGQVLTRVEGPGGVAVSFGYDAAGHLVEARREADARVELYGYSTVADPLVPLRTVLASVTDGLDGGVTTYDYTSGRIGIQGVIEVPRVLAEKVTRPEGGETTFSYDLAGLLDRTGAELVHSVTDARGEQTTYALDTYGAPLRIVDPLGRETRMTWSADDRLMTSRTDANGHTTSYVYDEDGNPLSEEIDVVDVDGVLHTLRRESTVVPPESFDPPFIKDRPATTTDRNGHTTTFSYDPRGHLIESTIQVAGGPVTTRHTYLGNGDRASTSDPEGRTTFFAYDARGYLVTATDALGGETTMEWDDRGLPVARTDALGRTVTFEHDRLGRQVAAHRPLGATETVLFDDGANRTTRTDAAGRVRVEERDLEDRVVREVDPAGAERLFDYDPAGNKTLETSWFDLDTPRQDTTYEYDAAGRLAARTEPLGRRTTYELDAVGNVVRQALDDATDPEFEPRVTEADYDALDRRIRETRYLGGEPVTVESLLDGEGNLLRRTDPLGRETVHAYDALNRRVETDEPEGKVTRFSYDRQGNLTQEVRENTPDNQVRTFAYDALDRVVRRTDATGATTLLEYDAVGNLVREIDPLLNVTSHSFDALDRRIRTTRHLTRITEPARTAVTEWEHDLAGNVVAEHWANGNDVTHTYDALDRMLTTTDSLGALETFTYDARGNRLTEIDGNGNVTSNGWDALDRLVREERPEDLQLVHAYDAAGNRTETTDARGHTTRFRFDSLDRQVEETSAAPFEYTREVAYDLVGNKLSETDRRGLTTTYGYDDLDRLVTLTDPAPFSTTVSYTWDRVGNKASETDRRGITTLFEYDRENRLVRTERAGVVLSQTVWDAAGNKRFEHDANDDVTGYEYDERNLLIAIDRPEASITRYTLDDMGDRVEETDPEGRVTTRVYDVRRRLVEETDAASETTTFEHDGNGNITARVRPLLGRWEMDYDAADRLTAVRDPLGDETVYGYDANDNRTSIEDAEGNITTWDFDELDRRVRMEYADGAFETYDYDPEGNLVSRTDPNGRTVTTAWDELGRKSSESYPLPSPPAGDDLLSISWSYDEEGHPLTIDEVYSGPSGTRTSRRTWDDLDRLASATDPAGRTIAYQYDANGNRTRLTDPDGKVTHYAFDGLNRPTSVAISGAGVTEYGYFKDSRLKRVDFPNGTRADYTYDAVGRVASIANTFGAATVSRYDYEYDANGNRTVQIEENGGAAETTTYGYDDADRLTEVVYPDRTVTYDYDGVGNRTGEQAADPGGTPLVDRTLAYNTRNQLTTVTDHLDPAASATYSWDPNGNQTAKTVATTTTTFTFDLRDRLVQVTQGASLLGRYAYDFQDLRTYKETPTDTLGYVYDDQSVLLQTDAATGTTVAKYDYGPDRLLSLDGATHGRQYYLHDALGSVVDLTHPDGTLAARYQWDAWGNPRSTSGASENPFGFTGHERDDGTGLYYAKARFYDAELGRFLSEDPLDGWHS